MKGTLDHVRRGESTPMNDQVELLFRQLESPSLETAMESSLALAFLLERALWPGRYDSTHQLVLTKDMLNLRLDVGSEVEDLITGLCNALASGKAPLGARITLGSVLGRTGRAACIASILSLMERECESLSDENVCALVASVLPGLLASQPRALLQAAVEEYNTASVLHRLLSRNSE